MAGWELRGKCSFEIWIYGGVGRLVRGDATIFWIYEVAFYKDFEDYFPHAAVFFMNWEFDTVATVCRKQKIQIQSIFFVIWELDTGRGDLPA